MTVFEEPPIVDLDELLDEQEEQQHRVTRVQLALVIIGGVVGVAGLLTVLVAASPALVDLVAWITTSVQHAAQR